MYYTYLLKIKNTSSLILIFLFTHLSSFLLTPLPHVIPDTRAKVNVLVYSLLPFFSRSLVMYEYISTYIGLVVIYITKLTLHNSHFSITHKKNRMSQSVSVELILYQQLHNINAWQLIQPICYWWTFRMFLILSL